MSFPINCTECGKPVQRFDEETDVCVNGACDFVDFPVPHEPDDPQELRWTDELGTAA